MKKILPLIVVSQFCCTSLWFAGNAVVADISKLLSLNSSAIANITSAVQFGFISGTLLFALFTIPDRFSPVKVFFVCAIAGAAFNAGVLFSTNFIQVLLWRFLTGVALAGIYPVGMKIAADHFKEGLGKALGYLVGALVIGTSLPHLIKNYTAELPWKYVIISTSALAVIGGLLMLLFVPDGPGRTRGSKLKLAAVFTTFKDKSFRAAALGYFGHMWELYTFYAFIPVIVSVYKMEQSLSVSTSFLSFLIIAIGGLGCVIGGYIARQKGSAATAFIALTCSFACCLLSPFIFHLPSSVFLFILLFWGFTVVMDSPQFSTLIAKYAVPQWKGSALTIVNCIGFSLTIISIQCITYLSRFVGQKSLYMFLGIGPLLGLIAMRRLLFDKQIGEANGKASRTPFT